MATQKTKPGKPPYITPEQLRDYALSLGWQLQDSTVEGYFYLQRESWNDGIIFPMTEDHPNWPDYSMTALDIMAALLHTSPGRILLNIQYPEGNIVANALIAWLTMSRLANPGQALEDDLSLTKGFYAGINAAIQIIQKAGEIGAAASIMHDEMLEVAKDLRKSRLSKLN